MLKAYVGTKILLGEPMDSRTFEIEIKKVNPDESFTTLEGYHVVYPDDYHSWSPKEVFENAYRELLKGETLFVLECAAELFKKKGVENGHKK